MDEAEVCAILECLVDSSAVQDLLKKLNNKTSILHAAITLPVENKRRIVKTLIEAGADCDRRDENGRTACELALCVLGDRELASEMIDTEMGNFSNRRAFYVLIRRGSLAVLKLFLEQRRFDDETLFGLLSNTMIELNVKRVEIESRLEVYLQHCLAKYAFKNLSGDRSNEKDVNEWRVHFKIIANNWNTLKKRYSDRNYTHIDNEFIHRAQTIHNHLYFVKDKRFMRHLPMMEIVFCLAIYLAICKWPGEYGIFKLIINKLNVMQFLEVICKQIITIELRLDVFAEQLINLIEACYDEDGVASKQQLLNHWSNENPGNHLSENIANKIISGYKRKLKVQTISDEIIANETIDPMVKINRRDRSTLKRLRRCYFRTKQLYSIQKCIFHQQEMTNCPRTVTSSPVIVPAVKRTIQVIGEAVKSTKNSPNIPKKIEAILAQMLTNFFPTTNQYFREFFSHKYSMAKRFLFGPSESLYYNTIVSRLGHVEMIFAVSFVCSVLEACRSLLGAMRRCKSVDELRSLLQFIGDLKMVEIAQAQQFQKVETMFKKMSETVTKSQGDQRKVFYLKEALKKKEMVLKPLRVTLLGKWSVSFDDIKMAVLGGTELNTIRRMIDWNLSVVELREIYENIRRYWLSDHVIFGYLEVHDSDMINHDPSVMSGILATIENKLRLIEEEDYPLVTRGILKDLGITEPTQELIDVLHRQLLKYYENIFFLDNKYKIIKQVFKKQKLRIDDEIFKSIRIRDERSLQKIFDDRVNDIRKMFSICGIFSVDDLTAQLLKIPMHIVFALEYCQLELNEMLISVGYFGDNFHWLKHRIPLIHGRNYRNYLAHDTLSYNILTDSTRTKVIVNAFVLMNSAVNLFGKYSTKTDSEFSFVSTEDLIKWPKLQDCLANGFREMNVGEIQKCIKEGADVLGVVCTEKGVYEPFEFEASCVDLIDPNYSQDVLDSVIQIVKGDLPKCGKNISSPSYRSWYACNSGNMEKAFDMFKKHQPVKNLALPQRFFYWNDFANQLPIEVLKSDTKDHSQRTILTRFAVAGNFTGVEKVLDLCPQEEVLVALGYAVRFGFIQIAELLLSKHPNLTDDIQQMTIINHMHKLLTQVFVEFNDALLFNEIYTMTAVRANNLSALMFIIDRLYIDDNAYLKIKHLPNILSLAAYLNRFEIAKFLLSIPNVDYFSTEAQSGGHSALMHAVRLNNMPAVKMFLESGASPHWIHPNRYQQHRTAFQIAVEANSCTLVGMMAHVERNSYRNMEHPLSIAIRKDSLKMIRFLQKLGYTMLDSDRILHSSVKYDNLKFCNEILQELNEVVGTWKPSEKLLITVTHLLNRWKAIAYLECPESGSITAVMQSVELTSCDVLLNLLSKSNCIRQFDEKYLISVQFYSSKGIYCSYGVEESLEQTKLFGCCTSLLDRLKINIENGENVSQIYHLQDTIIEYYPSGCRDDHSIDINVLANHFQNLPICLEKVMELFNNPKDLLLASMQTSTYFIISKDISCHFELSDSKPTQSLKLMVNAGDHTGETPLHLVATQRGNLDFMNILLANGANLLANNSVNQTPLHLALIGPNSAKAMLLLNHCIEHDLKTSNNTSALELPNQQGFRPIHIACLLGKSDAVQLLLQQTVDVRALDSLGLHAAIHALCSGQLKALRLLLEYDPGLVHLTDSHGKSLLHYSTKRQDDDAVLLLLEYDVDLAAKDIEGRSAVQMAFEQLYRSWLKIVLFYARINGVTGLMDQLSDQGVSALAFSTFLNKSDLMQAIVEYEIDAELDGELNDENLRKLFSILTAKTDDEGYTALHIATRLNFMESAEFILHCQRQYNKFSEQKLNLAFQVIDMQGKTPLDYALGMQNELLVNMILKSE